MNNLLPRYKYSHWLLTLAFGLAVFLFWNFRYPFALTYQEQFQLFLFDGDYLLSRLAEPGGLARYVAEFLVQFYNGVALGAVILAVLYMLVQRLTWRLMFCKKHYALSFIPSILIWYAMGDESVMLTFVVALVMNMAVTWAVKLQFDHWSSGKTAQQRRGTPRLFRRLLLMLVMIPLMYWLTGPMVLLTAAFLMPVSLIYALALILLSAHFLPYPLSRLMLGLSYYRFPEVLPYSLMAVPVVVWLIGGFSRMLPKGRPWVAVAEVVVILLGFGALAVSLGFDVRKYDLMEYDYLVRVKDWRGIIAKSEKKNPDLPMSVSATNLALAMTNQLGDRAFDFYQHGSQGLLPKFERNFTTAQLTGEIYFHLGLVNTAQRFAFESMEALPNYNKSARVVKRLAETNLINGQYDVARKYLQLLEKTVFYRPWAQRTIALLGNEKAIDEHPLYGWLRKVRLDEDILFSEDELDKICGQLFMHDHQNAMAMQYLVMAPLLDGDAQRFMTYVAYVQGEVNYNPRCVREAIAKVRRMK